jgi:RNA polymerase sigma-70 factor (ECF subfamily)
VYRIAHNVALTRRTRRAQREAREQPLDEAIAGTTEMDFRRVALKQAIREMHPADRMLTLLWLEGLTAAEIEEVTGMKAATVAVRLSRIRKRLHPGSESYE